LTQVVFSRVCIETCGSKGGSRVIYEIKVPDLSLICICTWFEDIAINGLDIPICLEGNVLKKRRTNVYVSYASSEWAHA